MLDNPATQFCTEIFESIFPKRVVIVGTARYEDMLQMSATVQFAQDFSDFVVPVNHDRLNLITAEIRNPQLQFPLLVFVLSLRCSSTVLGSIRPLHDAIMHPLVFAE